MEFQNKKILDHFSSSFLNPKCWIQDLRLRPEILVSLFLVLGGVKGFRSLSGLFNIHINTPEVCEILIFPPIFLKLHVAEKNQATSQNYLD